MKIVPALPAKSVGFPGNVVLLHSCDENAVDV